MLANQEHKLDLIEFKIIRIWDQFYKVAFDIVGPFKIKLGNKYVLVAIDHYSKWYDVKAVVDHDAKIAIRFL